MKLFGLVLALLVIAFFVVDWESDGPRGFHLDVSLKILDARTGRPLVGYGVLTLPDQALVTNDEWIVKSWALFEHAPKGDALAERGAVAGKTGPDGAVSLSLFVRSSREELRKREGCPFIAVIRLVPGPDLLAVVETSGKWVLDAQTGRYRFTMDALRIAIPR
jgi:hypothetical protein